MRKRFVVVVGFFMMMAIVILGMRVWQLEHSIESLRQQVQSEPRVIFMPTNGPRATEHPEQRKIFKLLESADSKEGATAIGIPWSVERAMMINTF